ncbi:MAG: hypothetical protein JRG91_06865 [Deltaproteobacteria bacterium]|nr:hypothetical protein [Deltaproteobacteria bacterium]
MSYLPYLERVLALYSDGDGLDVVMEARSTFTELSGRFSEEDAWHETWSRLFLDWFGFDYAVAPYRSPIHRYVVERYEEITSEGSLTLFRGLLATHRSIFEVRRWSGGKLRLVDVIGGGRWVLEQPFALGGLRSGDIIDARIVPMQGELTLGAGIIFHPDEAVPYISALVEHLRDRGQLGWKTVHLLARMNLQHLQGPSLKLRSIYTPKSFLIRSYV